MTRIQEISTANDNLFHLPDGPGQAQRDAQLAAAVPTDHDWLYRHDATTITS